MKRRGGEGGREREEGGSEGEREEGGKEGEVKEKKRERERCIIDLGSKENNNSIHLRLLETSSAVVISLGTLTSSILCVKQWYI